MKKSAEFIGYQEGVEDLGAYAMFNIVWKGHVKDRSTVDANELVYLGIPVPNSPSYEDWKSRGQK